MSAAPGTEEALRQANEQLQVRQREIQQLAHELEDTNRGVVALYAELDDRVEQLRRANALRAQFTSYLSHEFRTPLDSMIALSGLLLDRLDGDLTPEQEKQVLLMRRSAQDLLNLVDDLLDTARVEAGQVVIRPSVFAVADLFSALRATLRPLLTSSRVALVFEEPDDVDALETDEARLSQILRNFIANALKFTERGEIRVRAAAVDAETVRFSVSDTGVGIEPASLEQLFLDFTRLEGPLRRRAKGSGLGLALSKKLALMLGGDVGVESQLGVGSTFFVEIPRVHPGETGAAAPEEDAP